MVEERESGMESEESRAAEVQGAADPDGTQDGELTGTVAAAGVATVDATVPPPAPGPEVPRPLAGIGPGALAALAAAAGMWLLADDGRGGIVGGILLLSVALGTAGVAVGGRPYGPDVEGRLDLSARLALGLLGGALAGIAHGVLTEAAGTLSLPALLGVGLDTDLSAAEWGRRVLAGGGWGLLLGLLLPAVPGGGFASRGANFSLLPTFYVLFVHYPVFLGVGLLGVRLGWLTFLFVLAGNAAAGVLAAWVVSWGDTTEHAPVSRPLVG